MIKREKTRIVLPVLLLLVVSAGIFAENTISIQTPVASEKSEEKQQMIYDAVQEGVVAAGYKPGDTSNPSHSDRGIGDSYPVNLVSWYEAVRFCNKLSELDGLDAAYRISGTKVSCDWSKNGYRLPKEAEWEYAARGGSWYYNASGCRSANRLINYPENRGQRLGFRLARPAVQ
ncbi:MAG: SUMF1/EgtB/PvdO family nonheme iron enzyme [Spirochaetota bacterium]|nr:SUMF1/EgtB/PvdO family nonheme iron enzyme [Spirochaetota bacterium]